MTTTFNGRYILNKNGEPVPEPDLLKWARWFNKIENRRVKVTRISPTVKVSTVFLGLDYSLVGGKPVLYETMVFFKEKGVDEERDYTRKEAIKTHNRIVREIKSKKKINES